MLTTGHPSMEKGKEYLSSILFFLFLVALPLSKGVTSVLIAVLLVTGFLRHRIGNEPYGGWPPLFFLPVVFFLMHVLGMCWTTNLSFGLFDLGIKVHLLLLPMVVWLHAGFIRLHLFRLVQWLSLSMGLSLTYKLLLAAIQFRQTGNSGVFFYESFSNGVHPSYFAFEIDVAILLFLAFGRASGVFKWVFVSFLSMGVLLLNSKAGILMWFLAVPGYLVWNAVSDRDRRLAVRAIALMVFFIALHLLLARISENRMARMVEVITQQQMEDRQPESSAQRIAIWKSAWALTLQNPWLGTGTGDIKDVLVGEYRERGLRWAAEKQLNVHNQFLQSWLTLGLAGAFSLLALFLVPFLAGWKRKDKVLMLFLIVAGLNFLVESMLETQSGTIFFSFIYSVLLIRYFDAINSLRNP